MRFPRSLAQFFIRWFTSHYRVNIEEAEKDIPQYSSLADFFVRNLKPGCRQVEEGVVSAVDGMISQYGAITNGELLQVKDKIYQVADLLGDSSLSQSFVNGYYVTIYLAPPDYHHIHSPVHGKITDTYCISGKLWPVNSWAVHHIDDLFSQNERMITVIDSDLGKVCVVMVGACNVGSVRLAYDDLVTNARPGGFFEKKASEHRHYDPSVEVRKGERLGTFCFGSTVVLLFEADRFSPGPKCRGGRIQFGESLSAS